MNKNKILKELLEQNPNIPKEKIEEIFKVLIESNPEIEIDKNFKKNLKKRLLNTGNFQKENFFKKYFKIFVPVFSIFGIFLIFSFFYFGNLEKENFSSNNIETMKSEYFLRNSVNVDNFQNEVIQEEKNLIKPALFLIDEENLMKKENIFKEKCISGKFEYFEENFQMFCKNSSKLCSEKDFEEGKCDFLK